MTIDAGIEHVKGDMFVSVPKGDAIFLKVSKLRRYRFPVIVITQLYFHKYTNIEFKNILLVGWP